MKTLYIIGNGFDMYHGLDTKYQSFGFFLKKKHSRIYDYLTDYYGLPHLEDIDDNYYEWANFERVLADLDYESVLDDNSDYLPNIASDEFKSGDWHALQQVMNGVVDDLTDNLFEAFKEFILNVHFPKISSSDLLKIDKYSFFISFNYTDSLEHYYNITAKNIFYIHKKAKSNDVLILGHGTDPDNFIVEDEKMPEGLSLEEQDEWREQMSDSFDFSYEQGRDKILDYFSKSFKYTEDIISQNKFFFDRLTDVKKVIVLGHSISDVDQPYFKKILQSIENKTIVWTVSYYGDKKPIYDHLIEIGLNEKQINLITLNEIKVKNDNNYKLF